MDIYNTIKTTLASCMKGPADRRDALKVIAAELQRQCSSELTDREVVRVLKAMQKDEKDLLTAKGLPVQSAFLTEIEAVLPVEAPPKVGAVEILEFLRTVDFSALKTRMAAVGLAVKHFGGDASSEDIKKIVTDYTP